MASVWRATIASGNDICKSAVLQGGGVVTVAKVRTRLVAFFVFHLVNLEDLDDFILIFVTTLFTGLGNRHM